ncbi:TonB-dependent receptor plug domain-containing protein [Caulobacter segnis]
MTEADIKNSGANSVGELLQKLSAGAPPQQQRHPGHSPSCRGQLDQPALSRRGRGQRQPRAGAGRRPPLVDGVGQRGFRRLPVDLNTMPLGMVEGIEVLKDGAPKDLRLGRHRRRGQHQVGPRLRRHEGPGQVRR